MRVPKAVIKTLTGQNTGTPQRGYNRMNDTFNKKLWELAKDSPELQETIARTITSEAGYSIPTRRISNLTGELEDITITAQEIEDPAKRERATAKIVQAMDLTVRDLAIRLGVLHVAYTLKEARGETLTPQERTLKDLDIIALAYTLQYMNFPKEAYKSYPNPEEFNKARYGLASNEEGD